MKRFFGMLLLVLTLSFTGCASLTLDADISSGQATLAKLQAGVTWMQDTLVSLKGAVSVAKLKYPDKAREIEVEIEPVLDELTAAVAAYATAVQDLDVPATATAWEVARRLVSRLWGLAMPYVVGAVL